MPIVTPASRISHGGQQQQEQQEQQEQQRQQQQQEQQQEQQQRAGRLPGAGLDTQKQNTRLNMSLFLMDGWLSGDHLSTRQPLPLLIQLARLPCRCRRPTDSCTMAHRYRLTPACQYA